MKNKLVAIGILILLSLLGYGIYAGVSVYQRTNVVREAEIESSTTEKTGEEVTEVIWEDIEPVEGTCPECEKEEVLSASSKAVECKNYFGKFATTPVIIDTSGNVDFKDGNSSGNMVSKDASIEITYVTAPTILLSGSSQVEDSLQLISRKSGAVKAAGNILDPSQVAGEITPDETSTFENTLLSAPYRKAFGSEVEASFTETDESGSVGDISVKTLYEAKCLECQKSNYNPKEAQYLSSEMYANLSTPGDSMTKPLNEEEYLTDESGMVEEIPAAAAETICEDAPSILEFVSSLIPFDIFNRCNIPDKDGNYPDDCIRPEDIVIRTSSFFGNYLSCQGDGECINTFMNERYFLLASPSDAEEYDGNFLVKTPCGIRVEGEEYDVVCLWDMSYIANEYYYQWQYHDPDSEIPEWDAYWDSIEKDMLKRTGSPS